MKQTVIIALVCLNLALVAALAWGPVTQTQAQKFRSTDYLMFTTQVGLSTEAVCVVDLASRRMAAWQLTSERGGRWNWRRLRGTRDLNRDFRRTGR